jgi:hypothetical protein
MRKQPITLALALALVISATGCHHIFGDSRLAQVVAHGLTVDDGHVWHAEAGYTLEDWSAEVQNIARKKPGGITIALGITDSATWEPDFAWTARDEAIWSWTIASVYLVTCLTIVLTRMPPSADTHFPGLREQVDKFNAFILSLTTARIDRVIWWEPTDDELADGVHLATDAAARRFYATVASECP